MNAKLKGYRVMAGFTQDDMARALGISNAMYSYCENGKRSFMTSQEKKVLNLLKKRLPTLRYEEVFPVDI